MSRRAVIYARISRDRVGAGLGVERQEADCRELAERLGWTIVGVRTDNDLSAYSGKPRPGYRALLDDLRDGRADAVLAWHTDRLHRSPVELEAYIGTCTEGRDVPTHCVKAGLLDLASPSGRLVARQLGAVARYEVEHMIERQKGAKAQAAAAGRYRGGPRPYGYARDGRTVVEHEAAVVRDATARVLAGESLRSVVRDLNDREIPTSTGATWKGPALRDVLLRARNAGLIEHEGQELAAAEWPAIVEEDVWRGLRGLLVDPARRTSRSSTERHLGTGVYRCGICGDGTTVRSSQLRDGYAEPVPAYRCRTSSHIHRRAAPIDELIEDVVIERLGMPDAALMLDAGARVDTVGLRTRNAALRARLDELSGLYATGAIDARQLTTGTASLREQIADVDAQLGHATSASPLAGFADADDVAGAWFAAPVARRKAIVGALMTVTLRPARRGRLPGGGRFDRDAVEIVWR